MTSVKFTCARNLEFRIRRVVLADQFLPSRQMRKSNRAMQITNVAVLEWSYGVADLDPPPTRKMDHRIPHTEAKYGGELYQIGDIVQLQADTAHKWVGIIRGFEMDYQYLRGEWMRAVVLWFCRQQDVLIKKR